MGIGKKGVKTKPVAKNLEDLIKAERKQYDSNRGNVNKGIGNFFINKGDKKE